MDDAIRGFKNEYEWLSNSVNRPIVFEGITYQNNVAAFQAQKTTSMIDRLFFGSMTPTKAKREGQKLTVRPDWDEVKDDIMYEIVKTKFSQHRDLLKLLLATGDRYLENTHTSKDTYWGVSRGKGENKLGHILMRVRHEFRLLLANLDTTL